MADIGENSTDLKAHESTYGGFTKLMLWGTVVSFGLGAFVVLMIAG